MKKLTFCVIAIAIIGAPAFAADLPVKAPPPAAPLHSWTGCYAGGNIGYGWAHKHIVDEEPGLVGADRDNHTNSGIVGGGQIGCDYQINSWVIGIQGMFDVADVNGSSIDPQNSILTWSSRNSWFATATGRLGYAILPTTLAYVKGGAAWVRDHNVLTFTGGTQSTPDTTMFGWTLGGGVEYAFAPRWSAFLEYDYVGLSTKDREPFTRSTDGAVFPYDVHNNLQTVLFGVNYHFGGL